MIQALSSFIEYLFDFTPPTNFDLQMGVWVVLIVNLAVALLIPIWVKLSNSKLLSRLLSGFTGKLLTIEAFLAINLFSRLAHVSVISMRFITFLILLWLIINYINLGLTIFKKWPTLKAAEAEKTPEKQHRFHIHKNKKRKTIKL